MRQRAAWVLAAAGSLAGMPAAVRGQDLPASPVFVDDSPAAADALAAVEGLRAVGNEREAVRALQRALETEAERLLATAEDPELFVPVRTLVHERLLGDAGLLSRYRELAGPDARAALAEGRVAEVERSALLTEAGFEACLRVAQGLITDARFDAAVRMLAQVDRHPDRVGAGADRATKLLRLAAGYTDDAGAAALLARWAGDAAAERIEGPADRYGVVRSSILGGVADAGGAAEDGGVPVDVAELTAEPLASARLTEYAPDVSPEERARRERALEAARSAAPSSPWTLPTVRGDTVFVNDGITVRAMDRFTLRTLWASRTDTDEGAEESWATLNRRRLGRTIEDSSTVSLAGGIVLATTGQATFGTREGDARLHALDARTGETLWAVDPSRVDPALADGSVRGPVLVVDGDAVVAVRKSVRARRLAAVHLVSMDVRTGDVRWVRGVGSAGALPFQAFGRPSGALASARGLVFACDELGVLGAVEASTGRPVWVRRMTARTPLNADRAGVFGTPTPLVDGESVLTLSPSGEEVLRVELATGRVLARRGAAAFGGVDYLLRMGGWLVAVGRDSVGFVPIADFERAPVRVVSLASAGGAPRSGRMNVPVARGRAAVSGGRVLVPVEGGLVEVDPERVDGPVYHALGATGTLVALPGQLLAVDELDAHSFLSWPIASAQLEARLEADPADAGPALTLAELAARVGETGRIVPALDAAAAALGRDTDEARRESLRSAVFDAVLEIARRSVEGGAGEGPGALPRIDDRAVLAAMVERLGAIARTATQRVDHLLLLGALREAGGDAAGAVEAYQRVLLDAELARTESRGSRVTIPAAREAGRRVERVVERSGYAAYAAWEALAREELAAAGGALSLGGGGAEGVLARYPMTSAAPGLWARVAEARAAEERVQAAARAWRSGVRAAEAIRAAGGPVDTEAAAGLVSELAAWLARVGRAEDARGELERARERLGAEVAARAADLFAAAGAGNAAGAGVDGARMARAGEAFARDAVPALLAGSPVAPLDGAADTGAAVFVRPGEGRIAFVELTDPAAPRTVWTAPVEGTLAPVLVSTAERVELLRPPESVGEPARLEALARGDGSLVWRAETLTDALASRGVGPATRVEERAVLVAVDAFTTVLVERRGTAAAFDRRTGRTLWARDLGAGAAADAALADGVLAVAAGATLAGDEPGSGARTVVCVDARTGEEMHRLERLGAAARFLRTTDAGDLLVFGEASVLSMALAEARVQWSTPVEAGVESAWALSEEAAVVLGADRRLRLLSLRSGRIDDGLMDDRLRAGLGGVLGAAHAGGRLAVVTGAGVLLYDGEGRLVGLDVVDRPTGGPIAAALLGDGGVVTLDAPVEAGTWRLSRLDGTGRLLDESPLAVPAALGLRAQSVTAVDGAVVVGFGAVSVVVRVP